MKKWQKILSLCVLLTAMGSAFGVMIVSAVVLYLYPQLPDVETLRDIKLQTPLRIYSADGLLMAEFGEKRRQPVQFENIPPLFINALLAAEDTRFYEHPGVDVKGLSRAVVQLISTGRKQSGGSTITMQVARNFFLTRKQTYMRKFNEILLALQIERVLTKEEILSLYVNKIYLGHRAYGIGAAAQVYYGRSLEELSLAELAMIAGLPKAPSRYNPISNPERAQVRRDWILQRMLSLSLIDQTQCDEARSAPITASLHGQQPELNEPYVAEMVRQALLDTYGPNIYEDGFSVTTTIDSHLQNAARKASFHGLIEYDQRHGYRGAESRLPTDILKQFTQLKIDQRVKPALEALNNFYAIGPLLPAVILDSQAEYARAVLNTGETVNIPVENMKWARRYLSVNSIGPEVKYATDVVQMGDIVRVTLNHSASSTTHPDTASNESTPIVTTPIATLAQVPHVQTALVSLDPNSGKLLTVIGGMDFRLSKFNRATQASRQVGSSIKPFIYSAALEQGYSAASLINDAPLVFSDKGLESVWRPENSGGRFNGPTRLRQALYQSRNLVSIRLLREIGVDTAINALTRFGFDESQLPRNLSLALGSAAFTPLEMATRYAILANGGYRVDSYFISEIRNAEDQVIFRAQPTLVCPECPEPESDRSAPTGMASANIASSNTVSSGIASSEAFSSSSSAQSIENPIQATAGVTSAPRVMDKQLWYIIRSMLGDVIQHGTGRRAKELGRNDLAGKTGTTNDQKDAWFNGFHRQLVTTVWVGFDEPNTLGAREFGGTAALPIWIDYMRTALAHIPETLPEAPPGLVTVLIDPETGQRARPGQNNAIFEVFRENNVPEAGRSASGAVSQEATGSTHLDEIF